MIVITSEYYIHKKAEIKALMIKYKNNNTIMQRLKRVDNILDKEYTKQRNQ